MTKTKNAGEKAKGKQKRQTDEIPSEQLEHHDVELPPRQTAAGNVGPDLHLRHIATPF